ncbi:MAG: hypothetical protein A3G41_04195 [Elusimicrobia bacterium RIFCSPLOWO2_12_FULL_59_9]|nr:MAG: hypothetical protein A3G41_04195 [Elusimicrobia bacterium RIFCSPLOWO2_12_FULL_59_9]
MEQAATGRLLRNLETLLVRARTKRVLLLTSDVGAVAGSFYLTFQIVETFLAVEDLGLHIQNLLFLTPLLLVLMAIEEGYKQLDYVRPEKDLETCVRGVSFSFLLLFGLNFVFFKTLIFSRYFIVGWYLLALLLVVAGRTTIRFLYHYCWNHNLAQQRAIFLGSAPLVASIQATLETQRYRGLRTLGYVTSGNAAHPPDLAIPCLGTWADWEEIVAAEKPNVVVIAFDEFSPRMHQSIFEMIRRCGDLGLPVIIGGADLFNLGTQQCELDQYSGLFVFTPRPKTLGLYFQRGLKRMLDLGLGVVGSLVTLCLVPFVAAAVKLEDGGPVFFRQEYLCPGGRKRRYLKFRTMRPDAARMLEEDPELRRKFEENFKLKEDPRITRVGRFLRRYSFDEFPEFFSVLKGDLSFVGPRTISSREAARYGPYVDKLLSVRPGLTGFWQVMGRQNTDYSSRIRMDMFYIDRWSLWIDLVIIAKTFWKVIRAEGAY